MMNEYELHEKFSETFKALEKAIAHTQDGPKFKRKLLNALSKGFPIDYKYNRVFASSREGDSLLHRSLWDNHDFTQILLDLGANVNVEDHNGMNALLIAAYTFEQCYDHEGNSIVPPYFKEILEKTDDINNVPYRLIRTTALGWLCRKYCKSQSESIMGAIKMLLEAGADINAGGDWLKVYSGPDDKKYYKVGEKLKAYISMYIQQKTNFKNGQEHAYYDYEL